VSPGDGNFVCASRHQYRGNAVIAARVEKRLAGVGGDVVRHCGDNDEWRLCQWRMAARLLERYVVGGVIIILKTMPCVRLEDA
jgi:hypothetical protein